MLRKAVTVIVFLAVFSILFFLFHNFIGKTGNEINGEEDFSSPENTLKTYLKACREEDFVKVDNCFKEEFQEFVKTDYNYKSHRNVNQLRNEYGYLKKYIENRDYKLEMYGDKAIIRFEPMFERPAPQYFVKENGQWKIDAMFSFNNIIVEDSQNWHWRNSNIDNEKTWIEK